LEAYAAAPDTRTRRRLARQLHATLRAAQQRCREAEALAHEQWQYWCEEHQRLMEERLHQYAEFQAAVAEVQRRIVHNSVQETVV
jgi:hypothetical protein